MPKPKTDEAFLAHLKRHAPEAHGAEVEFDKVMAQVVRADPSKLDLRPPRKRKRTTSTSNQKPQRTRPTTTNKTQ